MATVKLVPSTYFRSNTSYVTVTNDSNMYYDTSHTTDYATLRGRNRNSSTAYYAFIGGFNFDAVPSNATVNSFTVRIRCYRSSNQRTGTNFYMRLTYAHTSGSVISNTTTSTNIGTSVSTITIPTGSLTWSQMVGYGDDFSIEVPLASNSGSYPYVYVYGAEIEVDYTASTVHPTSVSVSPTTASIEVGSTVTLTETVLPSNASDKSVTWSTSNSSVATVSNGVVTGVGAGSATITVTTVDGGYTATCAVTVTQPVLHDYIQTNTLEPGKSYLIVNGNSGTVYMLSNESGGSRQLKGVATTISNGKISISTSVEAKCLFECSLYTTGDDLTTCLSINGQYLYSDNSSGLRMYTSPNSKHWHYVSDGHKFWLYRGTTNGYTDDTTEYKYYLTLSNGNYTDSHIGTSGESIENSTLPEMYLFRLDDGTGGSKIYIKSNNVWTEYEYSKIYKKVSGVWVEQSDISNVFSTSAHYKKGIIPRTATISGTGGQYYSHVTYNNTAYYTNGNTFTYSAGDSLNIHAESRSYMGFISIDGTTVASSTTGGVTYVWTLPDADISISINDAYVTITTL